MIRFPCDICGRIIEDVCGEYTEMDDEGIVLTYTCPYCGKTVIINQEE